MPQFPQRGKVGAAAKEAERAHNMETQLPRPQVEEPEGKAAESGRY